MAELKKAHEAKDIEAIDSSMEKLNTVFQAASQDMYNASNQEGAPSDGPTGEAEGQDEVTDVDFEEVSEEDKK